MLNSSPAHKKFVDLRDRTNTSSKKFNVYDFTSIVGIECALWPNLYPTLEFCEAMHSDKDNCASTKVAFMHKVFPKVSDNERNLESLQFHYDLWLFKTVLGAITTARKSHCSSARSLEAKTFSPDFWKWQHYCLIDSVRQFGFATLFITISPFEWSFPLPP